jgi:phenylacetic acid degradation operon negative regulatory protein
MRAKPEVLSTIEKAPISYFVYSALSFFGPRQGGALPGMWFVSALGEAGRDAAAVRQTLYRMEHEGELITRKAGRSKFYSASQYAKAEITGGTAKIFESRRTEWDRHWTFVHLRFRGAAHRIDRERVAAILGVEGFARLGGDVYVHPRASETSLRKSLPARTRPHVIIVRGPLLDEAAAPGFVDLWHVDQLRERYHHALTRLGDLEKILHGRPPTDRDAFLLRFAVVFEYLGVAWDDPGLPAEVLPRDWPAENARRIAARLYRRLLPGATRFAERLLKDVLHDTVRHAAA